MNLSIEKLKYLNARPKARVPSTDGFSDFDHSRLKMHTVPAIGR
jgi:hypothetical protein